MFWLKNTDRKPPNGWAVQTRRGQGFAHASSNGNDTVKLTVDFDGPALRKLPVNAPLQADVSIGNGQSTDLVIHRNDATGGWRMVVQMRTQDKEKPVEVRAFCVTAKKFWVRHGTTFVPLMQQWRAVVGAVGTPASSRVPDASIEAAVPGLQRTPMAPRAGGGSVRVSWMLRRLFGLEPRLRTSRSRARCRPSPPLCAAHAVAWSLRFMPRMCLNGLLPNVVTANETVDTAIAWGEGALLVVFALLTCWLAAGFWTAMMGFFVLVVGGDRHLISRSAGTAHADLARRAHGDRDADLQ